MKIDIGIGIGSSFIRVFGLMWFQQLHHDLLLVLLGFHTVRFFVSYVGKKGIN